MKKYTKTKICHLTLKTTMTFKKVQNMNLKQMWDINITNQIQQKSRI